MLNACQKTVGLIVHGLNVLSDKLFSNECICSVTMSILPSITYFFIYLVFFSFKKNCGFPTHFEYV